MSNTSAPLTTVTLEDGTFAVVKPDRHKPGLLEMIAIFFDAAHARDYADRENSRAAEPVAEPIEAPTQRRTEPAASSPDLSPRQSAVLEALCSKMDENKQVAAKAAVLAEAANVPLGSLHAVLQSLEKKGLIKTARAGSGRTPAVYQVV